jgi:hypothetical protein
MKTHRPHSPPRTTGSGRAFALVSTMLVLSAISILCVALFTLMRYEVATVGAHERQFRAELGIESGLNDTVRQIQSFLTRDDVGGASFTTWTYNATNRGSHLALTAGRPDKTTPTTPWLSDANTIWLGTINDPDVVWTKFAAGDPTVVDLNANGLISPDKRPLPAEWREQNAADGGLVTRYAVWVDDETSRLDLGILAEKARTSGESPNEIPIFNDKTLAPPIEERETWLTAQTARLALGGTGGLTSADDFLTTVHGQNYRVIQWAPPASTTGDVPARGRARRNLNWKGLSDSRINADTRVARLANWISAGAPEFRRYGAPSFWPSGSSDQLPNYQNPLADVVPHAFVRDNQIATIAASIIDYLDSDTVPTQPAWLAAKAVHLPSPLETDMKLLSELPLPEYFGADRCARINEMQIIWNSTGAADGYKARADVARTQISPGRWEYTIPVTWRFEIWNMDKNPIPARSYAIRTFFMQQIRSSTFGATGGFPIPETSEPVFLLNNGSPVAFGPNEIRTFDITVTYKRTSTIDRGTTWSSFSSGGSGTSDDEPDGHQRQAHVLVDAGTGEWIHATTYKQMTEAPSDGVCSAGIGTAGPSQGNKINDPRMEPLRSYLLNSTTGANMTVYDGERDGASNKPGRIGAVNNATGSKSFNYQDFARWIDRPKFTSLTAPLEGVTRIGNTAASSGGPAGIEANRFFSVGELGRIFDPGWVHPQGRGGNDNGAFAYHAGCRSPFRGGGTLRVGQSDGMERLAANSWNVIDLFDTDPGAKGELDDEEFTSILTRGRVNVNAPKSLPTGRSVLETVFALPGLNDNAPGENLAGGIDTSLLVRQIEARLTKNGASGVGGTITSWKQCRPFYSVGEMSELPVWEDPKFYKDAVTGVSGQPAGLNRGDAGREEPFARAAALITTFSHCYRIHVTASVGRRIGTGTFVEAARKTRQFTVFFEADFESDTGKLLSLRPRILASREL